MAISSTSWWDLRRPLGIFTAVGISVTVTFLAWVIFGNPSKGGLVSALAISLIYAMPMIFLSGLVVPIVGKRVDELPSPWDWVAFTFAILILSAVSITVSSGLMVLARIVSPTDPWPGLRLVNRLAFSMYLLFTLIARLLSTAVAGLENRNRTLEEKIAVEAQERSKQTQDIERAWEIQQGLFPKELPRVKGCEIAAGCQPARVVGGDYFDVIRLGDTRIAVAIADVVGKGMAAALLMSNLQAIVRSFVPSGISPADLCAKANEVIAGNIAPGKFITFFCAVIDTEQLVMEYCNAGHNPPVIVKGDGSIEKLTDGGPLLGVFPEKEYSSGRTKLSAGDVLVLFTDGITEAEMSPSEEFGESRLIDAVKSAQSQGAEAVRQAVLQSVRGFAGDSLQDDATLVVFTTEARRTRAAAGSAESNHS